MIKNNINYFNNILFIIFLFFMYGISFNNIQAEPVQQGLRITKTAQDFKDDGFKAAKLKILGATPKELKDSGYTVNEPVTPVIEPITEQQESSVNVTTKPNKFKWVDKQWIDEVTKGHQADPSFNKNSEQMDKNKADKFKWVTKEWIDKVTKGHQLTPTQESSVNENNIKQKYEEKRKFHIENYMLRQDLFNDNGEVVNNRNYNFQNNAISFETNPVYRFTTNVSHPTTQQEEIKRNSPYIFTTDVSGNQIQTDIYNFYFTILKDLQNNHNDIETFKEDLKKTIMDKQPYFNHTLETYILASNEILRDELVIFLQNLDFSSQINTELLNNSIDSFDRRLCKSNDLISLNNQFKDNTEKLYNINNQNDDLITDKLINTYENDILDLKLRVKAFLKQEDKNNFEFTDFRDRLLEIIDKIKEQNKNNIKLASEEIKNKYNDFKEMIDNKINNIKKKYQKIKAKGLDGINLLTEEKEIQNLIKDNVKLLNIINEKKQVIEDKNNNIKNQIDKINEEVLHGLTKKTEINEFFYKQLPIHFKRMYKLKDTIKSNNEALVSDWQEVSQEFEKFKNSFDPIKNENERMLEELSSYQIKHNNENKKLKEYIIKQNKEATIYQSSYDYNDKIYNKFKYSQDVIDQKYAEHDKEKETLKEEYQEEIQKREDELQKLELFNKLKSLQFKEHLKEDQDFKDYGNHFFNEVNVLKDEQEKIIHNMNLNIKNKNTKEKNNLEQTQKLLKKSFEINKNIFEAIKTSPIKEKLQNQKNLEQKINEHSKDIESKKSQITSNDKQITLNKEAIKSNDKQITSNKNSLSNLQSKTHIEKIKENNYAQGINAINQAITYNQKKIDEYKQSNQKLEEANNNIKKRIRNIQKELRDACDEEQRVSEKIELSLSPLITRLP
ncbi:MAG: hypothetical protein AB3N34_00475 [Lettuce witches'-broom phytoplasma]